MIARPDERTLVLLPRTHYHAPDGVRFVNLVVQAGGERVRIRFSRGSDTVLDIPLSGACLEKLIQLLGPLQGTPQELVSAEMNALRERDAVLKF
jgi:hypothetical protein